MALLIEHTINIDEMEMGWCGNPIQIQSRRDADGTAHRTSKTLYQGGRLVVTAPV